MLRNEASSVRKTMAVREDASFLSMTKTINDHQFRKFKQLPLSNEKKNPVNPVKKTCLTEI
jgi:hypothetical protein